MASSRRAAREVQLAIELGEVALKRVEREARRASHREPRTPEVGGQVHRAAFIGQPVGSSVHFHKVRQIRSGKHSAVHEDRLRAPNDTAVRVGHFADEVRAVAQADERVIAVGIRAYERIAGGSERRVVVRVAIHEHIFESGFAGILE